MQAFARHAESDIFAGVVILQAHHHLLQLLGTPDASISPHQDVSPTLEDSSWKVGRLNIDGNAASSDITSDLAMNLARRLANIIQQLHGRHQSLVSMLEFGQGSARVGKGDRQRHLIRVQQLEKLLMVLDSSPVVLSAWSAALKFSAASEMENLENISRAALELLGCFDVHRLGRLILAIGLAGDGYHSMAQPIQHLISGSISALPTSTNVIEDTSWKEPRCFPLSLFCQPDTPWPLNSRQSISSHVIIDVLCAYASIGYCHPLWVTQAASCLTKRWRQMTCQQELAVNRLGQERHAFNLPRLGYSDRYCSLVSWMDGGSSWIEESSEFSANYALRKGSGTRDLVDGLWALSQMLMLKSGEHIVTLDFLHDLSEAAEALLLHIVGSQGEDNSYALDVARILAYLTDLGHIPGKKCIASAAVLIETELLKVPYD